MTRETRSGPSLNIAYGCIRYHPAPGGAETHVRALAQGMAGRGHQVTVYTSDLYTEVPFTKLKGEHYSAGHLPPSGAERDGQVKVKRFRTSSLKGEVHYPLMPAMAKALLKAPVDVVHVHSYGYFQTLAGSLKRKLQPHSKEGGGPVLVFTPHYHPPWSMWGGQQRRAIREWIFDPLLGRWTVGAVDALIGVSQHELDQLEHYVGYDKARAHVIPNGIHLDLWQEPPEGKAFLAEHGQQLWASGKKEGPLLLYTGRLASNKGLEPLLRSLAQLVHEHPRLRLAMVGADTGEQQRLEVLARELDIAQKVLFTGHLTDELFIDVFGAADIFVLPSEYEAFGIVLLEAGAAGLPCVGTRVGGVPEVIEEGQTGEIVEYDDVAALTKALERLLGDPQRREMMGERARKRVFERFGWDSIVKRTESLYLDLLGK